jgi:hypothetical protein
VIQSVTAHSSTLATIIQAFHELMSAWESVRRDGQIISAKRPVLIFDEVHDLTRWTDQYDHQLDRLLDLFVSIIRRRSCHILLVADDHGIFDILSNSK